MNILSSHVDRFFGISNAGSSIITEVRAGLTTWLTMAYILVVNADILSKAIILESGTGFAQLMTATALAAAIGCFLMGFWAKYPFALAPGMGLNAYFSFTVVLTMQISWQSALAAVFVAGLVFIVLSISGLRAMIVRGIPAVLKRATAVGIGLFLAIIGFGNMGWTIDHPVTLVSLGQLGETGPLLGALGLLATTVALSLRWKGAILLGIVAISVVSIVSGAEVFQGEAFRGLDQGIVHSPVWPSELFWSMDFSNLLSPVMLGVIFGFLFVDFFDTAGTLFGLSEKVGYTNADGSLDRATQAFAADAVATTVGAALGVSPTTTYIESASGIEEGGKTGLTAVVVGVAFLLSIFFWPLASAVPSIATGPALVVVGAFMMSTVTRIEWDDYPTAIPAFLTVVGMPFTYSITNPIAFGIISYTLIHALTGRMRSIHPVMYVLSVLLAVFLASA